MDPREALILSLKREIAVLLAENEHLRTALHVHSEANEAGLLTDKIRTLTYI